MYRLYIHRICNKKQNYIYNIMTKMIWIFTFHLDFISFNAYKWIIFIPAVCFVCIYYSLAHCYLFRYMCVRVCVMEFAAQPSKGDVVGGGSMMAAFLCALYGPLRAHFPTLSLNHSSSHPTFILYYIINSNISILKSWPKKNIS